MERLCTPFTTVQEITTQPYFLIEENTGGIFGAFVTEPWQKSKGYYGTGESFLFVLSPKDKRNVYHWTQKNNFLIYSTDEELALGGGNGTFGLWLSADFENGSTGPCPTYDNAPLTDKEFFTTNYVEVWGFEPYDPNQ